MIKTTILTGVEQEVTFAGTHTIYWVQNLGSGDILVGLEPELADGKDDVLIVPSGGTGYVRRDAGTKTVYLSGAGKAQVYGTNNAFCPFKAVPKGGGELTTEGGTVTGTVDYPIIALNLYGNSVQDGTPTPEAPIDIASVGDDGTVNVVSYGGADFFEGQPLEYGTYADGGVKVEGTTAIRTVYKIYLKAGTYIINTQNAKRGVGYKFTDAGATTATQIFPWGDNNIPQIFTLAENAYCAFAFNNVPGTGDIKLEDVTDMKIQECSAVTITSGLPFCSVGDVCDELVYNVDGTGKIIKRTAKIDSYNGETITTDYISSTGGLDTGSEIVYVLEIPQEIELSAAGITALMKLQTYSGTTYIYNDEDAEMKVKIVTNPMFSELIKPVLDGINAKFEARISALEAAITSNT